MSSNPSTPAEDNSNISNAVKSASAVVATHNKVFNDWPTSNIYATSNSKPKRQVKSASKDNVPAWAKTRKYLWDKTGLSASDNLNGSLLRQAAIIAGTSNNLQSWYKARSRLFGSQV